MLAAQIVNNRPFRRWRDLEKVEGFDADLVNDLRGSGARLGRPGLGSKPKTPYNRTLKLLNPPKQVAETRGAGRTRLSKNIFSGDGQVDE